MIAENLRPGDEVEIPCEVGNGAFPTEMLVTFETTDGPVSGFVRKENLVATDKPDRAFVKGRVKEVTRDVITVIVRGSFFTTTGLASLSRDWASKNLRVPHAA